MDREQGDEGALVNGAVTREVGEGEELAPEPGTVGELVHFNGSATRIDGGGRCVLIQVMGFHGEPAVVVRLHEGRSWHRAVPGAGGSGTYELRLSEAVVTAHDATFAAVRGTGGGCVLAVLQGRVEVSSSSALDGVAVGALEAVALSAHGQVGRVRALTPAEIAADAWLEVNRLFDGDAGSGPVHPPAPGPERRPARSPRTRPAVRHGPPSGTRPSSASTRRERERPTPAAASAGEPTAETVSPGFRAGPETPTSLAVAEP
ncbi:MAG: hypothetical protein M3N68_14590, partial [Actinomycetota bacterium]|nr:hypothetical protein [Actinomycetota bacterium]